MAKNSFIYEIQKLKPIPSYQIYKGTVFETVDQSIDFVMSKLNRFVGTRKLGPQAPVEYDIPQEVVAEGIVNAVAHRDYTSAASVEVMLFADRLEIWNPGSLPPSLTIEGLSKPHSSQPGNPLIAEPLFLAKYIEKAGTGTVDIFDNCRKVGLKPPEFRLQNGFFVLTVWRKRMAKRNVGRIASQVTGQVDEDIIRLLKVIRGEISRQQLQQGLKLKSRANFEQRYLKPAIESGLIEYTIFDKPNSRLQKYRLTHKGMRYLQKLKKFVK